MIWICSSNARPLIVLVLGKSQRDNSFLAVRVDLLGKFIDALSVAKIFCAVTCFALCRRLCLLISHVSAQEGAGCQDEKGNFLLPSRPRVLLFSLSSAPHCAAELSRRPFRLPRSLHRSHTGKRCVGSGDDSVCAPVFTDIHLHMSPPWPIRSLILTFGFGETKLPPVATYYTFIIALHMIVSPLKQFADEMSLRFAPCSLIWLWAAKNILLSWYSSHGKTSQTLSSLKWKQAALVQTPITFWHISMRIHTPEQIKPLCLTNLLPPSSNSILRSTEITSLTTLPISIREERFTLLYLWKSNKMNPHTPSHSPCLDKKSPECAEVFTKAQSRFPITLPLLKKMS